MPKTRVHKIQIKHLRPLRKKFIEAANSSFSYLPTKERQKVIRDNNLLHLTVSYARPKRLLLGLSDDSGLHGYAIGGFNNASASLFWLYVDPTLRGRGYGLQLLGVFKEMAASKQCRTLSLSTHTHQDYYIKHGFSDVEKTTLHGVPMDIMKIRING